VKYGEYVVVKLCFEAWLIKVQMYDVAFCLQVWQWHGLGFDLRQSLFSGDVQVA